MLVNMEVKLERDCEQHSNQRKGGRMKRLFFFWVGLCILVFSYKESSAYLERSLRTRALGDDLIGILRDEYSDVYRNPAYLYRESKFKIFAQYNRTSSQDVRLFNPFDFSLRTEPTSSTLVVSKNLGVIPSGAPLTNENAVLAGLALPLSELGNLALAAEFRPSFSESRNEQTDVYAFSISQDRYVKDIRKSENLSKRNIGIFSVVYAKKLNSFSLGLDYRYIKGSQVSSTSSFNRSELWSFSTDSLLDWVNSEYENQSDFSSVSHRGRAGLTFSFHQNLNLDLVLSFESRKSPDLSSQISEVGDSSEVNQHILTSSFPHKLYIWTGFGDLKYVLSSGTELCFLLGATYQKDKNSGYRYHSDLTEDRITGFSDLGEENSVYNYDSKTFGLLLSAGLETDLKSSVKLVAGVKFRWGNERLDNSGYSQVHAKRVLQDSIYENLVVLEQMPVKKTFNSYKISAPVGLEIELVKKLYARAGVTAMYRDFNSETQSSHRTNLNYTLGAGYSIKDRIYIDLYTDRNVTDFQSWSFALGYVF